MLTYVNVRIRYIFIGLIYEELYSVGLEMMNEHYPCFHLHMNGVKLPFVRERAVCQCTVEYMSIH